MLCTFCGTENRPENKFCGMCGVRLERRQAERRVRQETLKCPSCGHVNDAGYKFCGMCGARVERRLRERRASVPEQPRASAIANVQLPPPEAPGRQVEPSPPLEHADKPDEAGTSPPESSPQLKTAPAIFRTETPRPVTIGGPSILGLGDEPQNTGEYLLEEEEGSSGGVLRRLVLIAILAAIAGLIFVGWRSTFRANPKSSPPPVASPSPSPASSPTPQDKGQDSPESEPSPKNDELHSSGGSPDEAKDEPEREIKGSSSTGTLTGREEKKVAGRNDHPSKGKKGPPGSINDLSSGHRRPSPMLLRAQQYLQGKGGVRQNCQEGLMYLKAATDKNEPAAAVQMGALYASGHCVQRNEVTAYRWFNSAHELEPANHWIQANLDQLWGRMTPQQRRQVAQ
jgi:hypothetical protein